MTDTILKMHIRNYLNAKYDFAITELSEIKIVELYEFINKDCIDTMFYTVVCKLFNKDDSIYLSIQVDFTDTDNAHLFIVSCVE